MTVRRRSTAMLVGLLLTGLLAPSCSSDDESRGPSPGCAEPGGPSSTTGGRFTIDGEERLYNLTVPEGLTQNDPVPMVVNLHGISGTDDGQDEMTGFPDVAEAEEFVLVSPQAPGEVPAWRLGRGSADHAFVEALITHVESELCIDRDAIFLTGFSQGGMLAMELACEAPDRYAAIAPVAGVIQVGGCDDREPVPLIGIHGAEDDIVRADGGYSPSVELATGLSEGPPRASIVADWAETNGCDAPPDPDGGPIDETATWRFRCPVGAETEYHEVAGVGHDWPRSGDTSGVDASELIWAFFERQLG